MKTVRSIICDTRGMYIVLTSDEQKVFGMMLVKSTSHWEQSCKRDYMLARKIGGQVAPYIKTRKEQNDWAKKMLKRLKKKASNHNISLRMTRKDLLQCFFLSRMQEQASEEFPNIENAYSSLDAKLVIAHMILSQPIPVKQTIKIIGEETNPQEVAKIITEKIAKEKIDYITTKSNERILTEKTAK